MDQPELDGRAHRRALDGLASLNWWSGTSRPFRNPLRKLCRELGREARVLDVGCGGGDVPVALGKWGLRRGVATRLTLCDRSPRAVAIALDRARNAGVPADGLVCDATIGSLPLGFDGVVSSLFLHHLSWESARDVLGEMSRAAARLLVVCDLNRSYSGYALATGASRLLTRSPVVHTDAPLSVRSAFTAEEASQLARDAGLEGALVERCWPKRWRLTWWRG